MIYDYNIGHPFFVLIEINKEVSYGFTNTEFTKKYGDKCAVDNVNINLIPGVYGLIGANGAGKTTLMRMICGVLSPTSGNILLNGKAIQELGEQYYSNIGYMPQILAFTQTSRPVIYALYGSCERTREGSSKN